MPPVILKQRHSVKGKNLIPIVRKMKNSRELISQPARVKSNTLTEGMSKEELVAAFREITGEDEVEMLDMAHKAASERNLRNLLHYTIVYANGVGQPVAQTLQRSVSGCRDKDNDCCK